MLKGMRLKLKWFIKEISLEIQIIDFGVEKYDKVLDLQHSFFDKLVEGKRTGEPCSEYILIGEHEPVVTLGRRANERNLLCSQDELRNKGIDVFKIGRGGDVTIHNPGQLIIYPILDLEKHGLGVKDYVDLLEETVITLLRKYKIVGEKIKGATGVWIDAGTEKERKISAIGIKCNRFCTMHGLSINVNNSLEGFSLINPCGFTDKGVTSILQENEEKIEMQEIKGEILRIFLSLLPL